MDKRDVQTRFRHQKLLNDSRPKADVAEATRLQDTGRISVVESYGMIVSEKELLVILSLEGEESHGIRINPDVALNLAINLLKAGNQMEWFSVKMENVDPPRLH